MATVTYISTVIVPFEFNHVVRYTTMPRDTIMNIFLWELSKNQVVHFVSERSDCSVDHEIIGTKRLLVY